MIKQQFVIGHTKRYQFIPNDTNNICGSFDLRYLGDRYEIWSFGIFGDYRNKGYGTQMLTEFLQQFNDTKPLYLYVYKKNEIAIRLYKKVGFAIVGNTSENIYEMQYMNCS
jgi:ribosomal protein S18 acetylase RimI-like enzyme